MKRFRLLTAFAIVAAVALFGLTATVQAHHSFAAEFDRNRPVQLHGTVTKVEWTNPHVWIYFNSKDAAGKTTNWGAELGPPHGLQGGGWRRDTLTIGTSIDVDGWMAKNGTNRVNARTITVSGTGGRPGQQLDAASSAGDQK
jgi:hypothetical protein